MAEEDSNIMLKAVIIVIAIVIIILGTVFFAYPEQAGAAVETVTKPISQAISGQAPAPAPTLKINPSPSPGEVTKTTIKPIPTPTKKKVYLWGSVGQVAPITAQTQSDISVSDVSQECLKCIYANVSYSFIPGNGELAIMYNGLIYPNLTQDMIQECQMCLGPI